MSILATLFVKLMLYLLELRIFLLLLQQCKIAKLKKQDFVKLNDCQKFPQLAAPELQVGPSFSGRVRAKS